MTRSNQLNENRRPADLVFLVMVRDRLGQVESARATFERLRELMRAPEIASVEENQDMLREAESLMGGAIELPANVFAP